MNFEMHFSEAFTSRLCVSRELLCQEWWWNSFSVQISLLVCTAASQHQWEHRVLSESGMCNRDLQPPLVLGVQVGVGSLTVYTSQQIHSPLFFVKVWVMSSRAGLTIGAPVNARHWGLVEEKEYIIGWCTDSGQAILLFTGNLTWSFSHVLLLLLMPERCLRH